MVVLFFFWASLFFVFFSYFGYPLTLKMYSKFHSCRILRKPITPMITMVITAYNEEKRIREKLENTLCLNYPYDKLQVIVASDGSTDRTNDIVKGYSDRGVELLMVSDHLGKENAQAQAVKIAKGEILVFSDVSTKIDATGLREMISNFADPSVGCVSSEDRMVPEKGKEIGGEGFYVQYEMWLRALESRCNSVVGLSGSFFSARKEVCGDFSSRMQSDFRTLLSSMRRGMRGVSDSQAIGYYKDIKDTTREFQRKVRTVVRGLTVFFNHLYFLNVFNFGLFSYQYLCHKLLRWIVPFCLILLFISGALASFKSDFYLSVFALQIGFYMLSLAGILFTGSKKNVFIKAASFFVIVNASIFFAWLKYLRGERVLHWQPSER